MIQKNNFTRYSLYFLLILPILLAFFYILHFSLDYPHGDQWNQEVATIGGYLNGSLSLEDLFSQHNESRPFFPRLVSIIIGIFGYNTQYESILALIISTISFAIIFLMYEKNHGISNRSLLLFLPIVFFYFNFYQMGNYLWGIHFGHAIAIFGLFFAVYVIDRNEPINFFFLLAIGATILASFSFFIGLTIWPICFIQLWMSTSLDRLKKLVLWGISGLVIFIVYFIGYTKPSNHPSLGSAFQDLYSGLSFFFTSVGSNISHSFFIARLGIIIIFLTLAIILAIWKKGIIKQNFNWISLILFSFLASLEITLARSGFGVEYAPMIKYFQITFMGIIGLYCISLNILFYDNTSRSPEYSPHKDAKIFSSSNDKINIKYILFGIVLILLLIGIIGHSIQGFQYGQSWQKKYTEYSNILITYESQPDSILMCIYPSPTRIRELAPILKNNNLSLFKAK